VIPARYASVRFPGKPLVDILGLPMVVRVFRRVARAAIFDALVVATDDARIAAACSAHGVPVCMTGAAHPSGTDRVREVALAGGASHIVNVQGDEPLVDPATLAALLAAIAATPGGVPVVATAATPLGEERDFHNPDCVKLAVSSGGNALYFSRSPLPYPRSGGVPEGALRHLGLYAFTRAALDTFGTLPPGRLETIEGLEQLRFLEADIPIRVVTVAAGAPAVDRPEDLAEIIRLCRIEEAS
jgi:3-deoxy-manno-octulosonate cytidylyltransferase (CMP-KDO synthetase)